MLSSFLVGVSTEFHLSFSKDLVLSCVMSFECRKICADILPPDPKNNIVVSVSSMLVTLQNLLYYVHQDWHPNSVDIQKFACLWKYEAYHGIL